VNHGQIKIVLVSASPKADRNDSISEYFTSLEEERFRSDSTEIYRINVRQCVLKAETEEAFQEMLEANAIVFTFPLYFFCLPGLLMRFIQDYDLYCAERPKSEKKAKVYAVVNCGFPEPEINEEAVRVIRSFSQKIGADFRFGVLIGSGGMLLGAKDAPFMKKTMAELSAAFETMKNDILINGETKNNIYISANFPRRLYLFMGDAGWRMSARKNGLKKKDLYRKPYRRDS
jgi:multimeric flavodoxin WrbA